MKTSSPAQNLAAVCRSAALLSTSGLALLALTFALLFAQSVSGAVGVFLDRGAWEQAANGSVLTETFNDFPVPPNYQLPAGINQIGILKIEVQRPSGNLIVPGDWFDTVNGTTFWRIEASTQNGSTPPVTPYVRFDTPVYAFGADFNSPFPPRLIMAVNGSALKLSDYIPGARNGFFGIVSTTPFNSVMFDVVSPFNTLHHADNVSFVYVPEPTGLTLVGAGLGIMGWRSGVRRSCKRAQA